MALAGGLPALVGYFLLPSLVAKDLLYNAFGAFAVAGILFGTRAHAVRRPGAWRLIAAGQAAFVAGDVTWNVFELVLHIDPFPSAADAFYLLGYPLLVLGLAGVAGSREERIDRTALIDASIVAVGVGLLSWVLLVAPRLAHEQGPWTRRLLAVSYPVLDVVVLGVLARVAFSPVARTPAFGFLTTGLLAFAGSDAVYTVLADRYTSGHPVDAGWLLSYLLWGVAALHPSVRELGAPPQLTGRRPGRGRLALLGTASLVGPALLLGQAVTGISGGTPVTEGGTVLMAILVLVRMVHLVREVARVEQEESGRKLRLQAAALEAVANMIVITDRDGRIEYVNQAFTRVTGYTLQEVAGKGIEVVNPAFEHEDARQELWEAVREGRPWQGQVVNARKDGSVYPEEQTITPILDPQGAVTNLVAVKTDITERKRQEARLSYLAQHDPLTGLLNRAALAQHLERAVAAARRGRPSALLYLDLDQFKVVNDTLGHAAGDRLLVTLAGILRANVRQEDVLARLGGDEFALLLSAVTPEQAVAVAEKLRALVADFRFSEGARVFDVDVSIGVASIDGTASDSEVLSRADIACYSAKAKGRNRVELYRPEQGEQQRLSSDAQWAVRLKDALREGRFRLHFQPIVSVRDGRVRHHEALLRLVDHDGRLIPAGAFIGAAERCGLVHEIDRWVIHAAFERLERELARGNPMQVAINLSGLSFREEETLHFIQQELADHGIDPGLVTFEITETATITNLAQAHEFIQALRAIGCRFALDDFGSRFSWYGYLRKLPVDFVKIDGAFIRQLPTDTINQTLVRSLNEAAHSLGITTIAEFVEDERVLKTLREIGVDFAQGHHLGRPAPEPVPA